MAFLKRCSKHDEIQAYLLKHLEFSGYHCEPYGIESGRGLKIHKELLKLREDPTAKFVRHQPDKIVINDNYAVFMDIKTLKNYDTNNYSIELDSYEALKKLDSIGTKILLIFNSKRDAPYGLVSCFINELNIHTEFPKGTCHDGSGTAFGLIRKQDQYFKPITHYFPKIDLSKELTKYEPIKIAPDNPQTILFPLNSRLEVSDVE